MKLGLSCLVVCSLICLSQCRKSNRLRKLENRINLNEGLNEFLHNSQQTKDEDLKYWMKCVPGVKIENGKRIVGGEEAKKNSWPWQVHLIKRSSSAEDRFYHACGGSIVAPDTVLTAAHCVTDRDTKKPQTPSSMRIVAGDYVMDTDRDGQTQVREILYIYIHPKYFRRPQEADLAILKLKTPLVYDENVTNVCMPVEPAVVGSECYATGWGQTLDDESRNTLRQVKVPIVSSKECRKDYKSDVIAGMICAGYKEGGHDSCQGDSGGPFVCQNEVDKSENRWRLQGVTSWGRGCGEPGYPGVYADVFYYRKWLSQYFHW